MTLATHVNRKEVKVYQHVSPNLSKVQIPVPPTMSVFQPGVPIVKVDDRVLEI